MSETIHRFHQGPARDLWSPYNSGYPEMAVAFAINTGVLSRDAIPAELLDYLGRPLQFYEHQRAPS